ncbi:hypothetical protein [Pseudoxanthomonas japonensis]|uniref:hypothetical protein n=1 Tax=Pseudoxanthomonas japonensis TaxID=69284 RepID=UPI003749CA2F
MKGEIYVKSREELKAALAVGNVRIIISDPDLGSKVRLVAKASKGALIAAIAAAGLSATMIWNPVGWTTALVGAAAAAPLIGAVSFLAVALGVGFIYAIHKNYKVTTRSTVTMPDGTKISNATVLEPTR